MSLSAVNYEKIAMFTEKIFHLQQSKVSIKYIIIIIFKYFNNYPTKVLVEQQREFSTLSTITEKKDNYIEIPTKRSFEIEDPEEDSEECRQRYVGRWTLSMI